MEKYQNKYRSASARAAWWNYGSNAAYFVTICTQNRIHYFGKIVNNEMILSELGKYAQSCWHEIPNHFPFVQLGGFVVMPDHIHGIITPLAGICANACVIGNPDLVVNGFVIHLKCFEK